MSRGVALLLLLPASLKAAKTIPPAPRSYVLNEGVIPPAAEARLSRTLIDFEQRTGHQFAVALFQSLDGEDLDDYSNRVFRAWRVGDAKTNDGLIFCLYKQERKWRVEVGYGLEGVITDLLAGRIAREQGVPHFRNGDFDGGVTAVVDALAAKLQGKEVPPPPSYGDSDDDVISYLAWKLQGKEVMTPWQRHFEGPLLGETRLNYLFLIYLIVQLVILRYRMSNYGMNSEEALGWFGRFMLLGRFGPFSTRKGGGFGGYSGGGGSSGGGGASGGW